MIIIGSLKKMSLFSKRSKLKGKTIGFVPTMGALHEGHMSLIRKARKENNITVVSIFVNPIQFGAGEDLKRYPRDLKRDAKLCKKEGVDIIFSPLKEEIYPKGYKTYVFVEGLSEALCGKYRPGHFKGVATVVIKFFNIVNPDIAYFGQKDAQQALIIKKMASDLNLPLRIKIMPTVREKDGLAMSSRNMYLSRQERKDALVLYQALNLAKGLTARGENDASYLINKMKQLIEKRKNVKVQYISIVGPESLEAVDEIKNKALVALAVWAGRTRLIDNAIIKLNTKR